MKNKIKDKIKQLTIDESKWTEGTLYSDGSYCALGALCKSLGYSDRKMKGCAFPRDLGDYPEWMDKIIENEEYEDILGDYLPDVDDNSFQEIVPAINDDMDLDVEEKKSLLRNVFKWVGIDLHFKKSKK